MIREISTHKRLYLLWGSAIAFVLLGVRFNSFFSIVAFLLFVFGVLVLPTKEAVLLAFGLFPYATLFKLGPETTSLFTICELLLLVLLLLRKRKVSAAFASSVLVFLAYIIFTSVHTFDASAIIKTILSFFLVAFLPEKLSEIDIKNVAYMSSVTAVFSMLLSSNKKFIPYLTPYYGDVNNYVDSSGQMTDTVRASGFFSDPNYCAMFLIITLSLLCVLYCLRKIGLEFWVLFLTILFAGLFTYSRSYFLCAIILIVFFLLFALIPHRRLAAFFFAIAIVFFIVLGVAGEIESINLVLDRFNSSDSNAATGRGALNSEYLLYLWENPSALFWGRGIATERLETSSNNVHNIYIEMLFKLGVFGSIIYIVALFFSLKSTVLKSGGKKRLIVSWLPLFFLGLMYGFLAGISDYALPFYIVIAMMSLKIGQGDEKRDEIVKNW